MLTSAGERSVSVVMRVKRDGRWTRLQAAYGRNGRIRPGYAQVGEKQQQFDGVVYEIRTYESRQAKYRTVGRNAADAEAERQRVEKEFLARAVAKDAGLKIEQKQERKALRQSADDYIEDCRDRGAEEAAAKAQLVCNEFLKTIKKTYLDEIERKDILKFHAALRKRGCEERTIHDKHNRVKSWFLFEKLDAKAILPPPPKYDKKLPTIYTRDEISSILAAAGPKERLAYLLALKCGLREQELCHLEYSDIDEELMTLRVQSKPAYGFRVKDSEERDITLPDDVLAAIKGRRKEHPKDALILPSSTGNVDRKMLRTLKQTAKRENLNCKRCEGCKSENNECQHWTLHKFRRSYATTLLRNAVDLRTVQHLMGHADLASTTRYLRPASADEARQKINAVEW